MKEAKRAAIASQKVMKETPTRARRLCKEMQVYWKRFEKVEKEHRKRAEKEALEQRKMDHELAEVSALSPFHAQLRVQTVSGCRA